MVYKLCYVDPDEPKAYFTSDWEHQWGDDWNDRPYEHNAGIPYCSYQDNNGIERDIPIKMVFFDLPGWYEMPCSNTDNSRYSVEDINNHRVPWISLDGHYIFAGISYTNFVKQIEELGGTIYTPKKKAGNYENKKC